MVPGYTNDSQNNYRYRILFLQFFLKETVKTEINCYFILPECDKLGGQGSALDLANQLMEKHFNFSVSLNKLIITKMTELIQNSLAIVAKFLRQ